MHKQRIPNKAIKSKFAIIAEKVALYNLYPRYIFAIFLQMTYQGTIEIKQSCLNTVRHILFLEHKAQAE